MIITSKAKVLGNLTPPRDPHFVGGAINACLEPYGLGMPESNNELRGGGILGVAKEIIYRAGGPANSVSNLIRNMGNGALYSTSDFPQILNGISQAAMLSGWESESQSYDRFCGATDVKTLRREQRLAVGGFGVLPKLDETGEFPGAVLVSTVIDGKADAYGAAFRLSYQSLVNNDLSGLIADSRALGRAAAVSLNSAVFGALAANLPAYDNGALFNTDAVDAAGGHANMASSGSAISSTSIALGKTVMRRQSGVRGDRPLNIRPRYLIVPAELEEQAWDAVGLPQGFGESGSDIERYLVDAGRVEPISTPYLSDATGWYLAANPGVAPLLNIAYLNGRREPSVASQPHFESNGMEFVVQFDFGVAVGDWRGGYLNPGA